jgi:hypothetical protein
LIAALVLSLLPGSLWAFGRPRWTKAKPHFETRDGHVFAVAVGKAKDDNEALATAAAEERARAELLRFLQGKSPGADVSGQVRGAVAAAVWRAGRGVVYVRLELDTSATPSPAGP